MIAVMSSTVHGPELRGANSRNRSAGRVGPVLGMRGGILNPVAVRVLLRA